MDRKNGERGYHIVTWGCQMNEEDSEQMSLFLEGMGYTAASAMEEADVVLLNTCSVRAKPEEKAWSVLGRLKEMKQQKPEMIIGVCGCMAQVKSDDFRRRAPHVDMVVGTGSISAIPELIEAVEARRAENLFPSEPFIVSDEKLGREAGSGLIPLSALALPVRKGVVVADVPERIATRKASLKAHVPIMYGCDKFCTFCIVPLTRGRERSRPTAEVLAEIEELAAGGTREVTLLGQTVNSYGKNLPEGRIPFARLLEQINNISGIARIRFTSPYPKDFTDELIEAIACLPAVCEQVHLPLQVGDDDLLAHMHRGYTTDMYRTIVSKLRAQVPNLVLSTDIMLGYPGETEEQFQNTMQMVEELRFDSAFMFAYSPRPGTKAAEMENQVPREVKVRRLEALIALQNGMTIEINKSQLGRTEEVLVEGRSHRDASRLSGYTRGMKMVHFPAPPVGEELIGKLVRVVLREAGLTGFQGEFEKEALPG